MVCGKALTVGFFTQGLSASQKDKWVGGGNLKKVEELGIV
jgi:hypothetical protein